MPRTTTTKADAVELPGWIAESAPGVFLQDDLFSAIDYVNHHIDDLVAYVVDTYGPESEIGHVQQLLQKPWLAKSVIENYTTNDFDKWDEVARRVFRPKTDWHILYFIGDIGSGKTTAAYDLANTGLEEYSREVCVVGNPASVPDFVTRVPSIAAAPPRSTVVLDEAAQNAGARNASTREGRAVPGTLATVRHDDKRLLVISQNTKMADNSFIKLASAFVVKPLGLMALRTEFKGLSRLLADCRELLPRNRRETLVIGKGMVRYRIERDEPEWNTHAVSTAYRRTTSESAAIREGIALRRGGLPYGAIARQMAYKFDLRDEAWWKREIRAATGGRDPLAAHS